MKITVMVIKEVEVPGTNHLGWIDRVVSDIEKDGDKVLTVFTESGVALESRKIYSPDGDESVDMKWKWVPVSLMGGFDFVKKMFE